MRRLASSFALLGLSIVAACGGGELASSASSSGGAAGTTDRTTRGFVVTILNFTRQTKPGAREGFDLDDTVSVGADERSCFKQDAVDESGREGIDNELSGIIPTVDELFKGAADGLIQSSIRDGQLVLLGELRGVDDLVDDPSVELVIVGGKKAHPSLGTDGVIEGFQTFSADPSVTSDASKTGRIEGGVFHAGPMDLAVPIAIFEISFTLHLKNVRFRAKVDEDGGLDGLFGGGIVIQELLDGVGKDGANSQYIPMMRLAMEASADLAPDADGVCRQLSAALAFRARPAFVRW